MERIKIQRRVQSLILAMAHFAVPRGNQLVVLVCYAGTIFYESTPGKGKKEGNRKRSFGKN